MKSETRNAYLHAMGIQVWRVRQTVPPTDAKSGNHSPRQTRVDSATPLAAQIAVPANAPSAPQQYDEFDIAAHSAGAMIVDLAASTFRAGPSATNSAPQIRETSDTFADLTAVWAALQTEVRGCTACKLHQGRTQTVFGVGDQHARWMIIGEAPGADEDRQGEPFVGRAGKLLNEMLFAVGVKREQVYIANIVKCRPPNNREPEPDEAAACSRYLHTQVKLIQPKLIVCVGRIAATNLLGTHPTLSQYRGKLHRYADTEIPVVVTYHPAYLLRNPLDKRRAWQDLQFAVSVYRPGAQ